MRQAVILGLITFSRGFPIMYPVNYGALASLFTLRFSSLMVVGYMTLTKLFS